MKSGSLFRIGVCATAFAVLSAAAFPVPVQSNRRSESSAQANKSASGKISSMANDAFSLDVKTSTLHFVTDDVTKITGTLAVGATASVEYRTDGEGRNVAIAVVVQSNG